MRVCVCLYALLLLFHRLPYINHHPSHDGGPSESTIDALELEADGVSETRDFRCPVPAIPASQTQALFFSQQAVFDAA